MDNCGNRMWKTAVISVNTGIFIIHTCKISDQSRYAVREVQFERVSLYICSHISRRMDGPVQTDTNFEGKP